MSHPVRSLFTSLIKMYKKDVSMYDLFEDILYLRKGELTKDDYMDLSDILYMFATLRNPYEKIGEIDELNDIPKPPMEVFIKLFFGSISNEVETTDVIRLFENRLDKDDMEKLKDEIEEQIQRITVSKASDKSKNNNEYGADVGFMIISFNKKNMPKA